MALDSLKLAEDHIFDVNPNAMTLDYVESVAKFRYALGIVVWLLHDYFIDSTKLSLLSSDEVAVADKLLIAVKNICLAIDKDATKNALVVADFLIKCIVRKFGMSTFLTTLCDKKRDYKWLVPKHLQKDSYKKQVSYSYVLLLLLGSYCMYLYGY